MIKVVPIFCKKMSSIVQMNSVVSMILLISFIAIDGSVTMTPVWNVEQYFKDKLKSSKASTSTLKFNSDVRTSSLPPDFNAKLFFGVFHGNFISGDQYMARCNAKKDCDAGIRMICNDGRCTCKVGELFFEWPKYGCFVKARMFDKCEVSGQCMAMNPNTYCNPENGRCTCSPNYFFNGQECSLRYDSSNLKAQEVYKAAVVAAACFIVAVVGIFVACIVRRSFCRREQQLQQSESNRNSDIFSISDEIAALRAVDKPPSYEEVLQIERTFYGIPPPEYSGPRNDIASSTVPMPTASTSTPSESLNPPANPTFQSTDVASDRCISLTECLKESTTSSATLGESSRDNSHAQIASAPDFITAAEVLPVPSDMESTNQNMPPFVSGASSHIAHSGFYSSTPPPRLHRNQVKYEQGSSSLPSSPYLNTISSKVCAAVVDLHTLSKEHLKVDSTTSQQPETSYLSQDSFLSHSETESMSSSQEVSRSASTSEYDHSVTVIAYDNLGFESDLYL